MRKRITNWKKGSFTVEAAAVMPLVLFAVFGVLSLSLHVHNRSILRAGACEAVQCGVLEGVYEQGLVYGRTEERARELLSVGLSGSEAAGKTEIGEAIRVSYEIRTRVPLVGNLWSCEISANSQRICPTQYIREQTGERE